MDRSVIFKQIVGEIPLQAANFLVFYIQVMRLQFYKHKQEVMFVTSGFMVCAGQLLEAT